MNFVNIDKKNLEAGIKQLYDSYKLFVPVKEKNFYLFRHSYNCEFLSENYFNTRLSPKFVVFPQSETIFSYTTDEKSEECNLMKTPKKDKLSPLVFGIRPCDSNSFLIVKKNFDTEEYKDPYWINRYESAVFIGLACDNPHSTCFCTTAGSGPFDEKGLDILLIENDKNFIGKVLTEKGKEVAEKAGWTESAGKEVSEITEERKKRAEKKITSFVSAEKIGKKTILELYNDPFWEKEIFSCINCGTCTYVCPTCWCFDIQDENKGKNGIRMRNWDSCMFSLFTMHGSGHNPRNQKYQRTRQRFMHKLKYYQDKYQSGIQCAGCGRCIRLCPANIDIRKICDMMNS